MGYNYYAVRNGRKTGIFEDWNSARNQIHGYSNNEWAGFDDYAEAQAYLSEYRDSSGFEVDSWEHYRLYFDGASRNNGRPDSEAGIGAVLIDPWDREVGAISVYLGQAYTSNYAEYKALIHGLAAAIEVDVKNISIFGDSEIVVNQVTGRYKVHNHILKGLHSDVMDLLEDFDDWSIEWIPRDENERADELSNDVLDGDEFVGMQTDEGPVFYNIP